MDWSRRLSGKEVAGYLIFLVLYVAGTIVLGLIYESLGWTFLVRPSGRGSAIPFLLVWLGLLFLLTAVPFFRNRFSLTLALSAGGTAFAAICLWLWSR